MGVKWKINGNILDEVEIAGIFAEVDYVVFLSYFKGALTRGLWWCTKK